MAEINKSSPRHLVLLTREFGRALAESFHISVTRSMNSEVKGASCDDCDSEAPNSQYLDGQNPWFVSELPEIN